MTAFQQFQYVEEPSFSADGLAFLPAGPIPTVADPSPLVPGITLALVYELV